MSKRKKKEKQQDFQKKKLKVGKTNIKPDSFTDTSFTAKTIVLKNQSITQDKSQEFTTSRKLTCQDLLSQLKHHNVHTRKEAIMGLHELLSTHPEAFHHKTNQCMDALSKLMIDQEKSVRKQLLSFLPEYLDSVSEKSIEPFASVYMAYLYSSMNHILDDIRVDGFKFLQLTLKRYPSLVKKFESKVIPSFLGVLCHSSTQQSSNQRKRETTKVTSHLISNPSSQLYSVQSRMEILDIFSQVLHSCIPELGEKNWYLKGYGVPLSNLSTYINAEESTETQISHQRSNVSFMDPKSQMFLESSSSFAAFSVSNSENVISWTQLDQIQSFMDKVIPTLVDFWIEAYPNAFGVGTLSMNVHVSVLLSILQLLNLMIRTALFASFSSAAHTLKGNSTRSWDNKHVMNPNEETGFLLSVKLLNSLDKHILGHFPFAQHAVISRKDKELESNISNMNVIAANILSCLMFSHHTQKSNQAVTAPSIASSATLKKKKNDDRIENYLQNVQNFLDDLLHVSSQNSVEKISKHTNLTLGELPARNITTHFHNAIHLENCLPVIWISMSQANLPFNPRDDSSMIDSTPSSASNLFGRLIEYYLTIPYAVGSKLVLLSFIDKVLKLTLDRRYTGPPLLSPNKGIDVWNAFLCHLYDTIKRELKNNHSPKITETNATPKMNKESIFAPSSLCTLSFRTLLWVFKFDVNGIRLRSPDSVEEGLFSNLTHVLKEKEDELPLDWILLLEELEYYCFHSDKEE